MTNSTTSHHQEFLSILSLGVINVLTSTPDLVISFRFFVKVYDYDFEGNIIVIVNGQVLHDDVISFFKNSENVRPTSLQGKGRVHLENLRFLMVWSIKEPLPPFCGVNGLLFVIEVFFRRVRL